MLPVYLKIFDERLLFAQGSPGGAQSIPLYTVFTGQAAMYFCLIEGDGRRKSWYRIVHASGRREDEPFAELRVACLDGSVTVTLADSGGGTLRQAPDVDAELSGMYQEGDYAGVLGIDHGCKDPQIFERACETQKLVFSEEKELQVICDNAEHRLAAKYRPSPSPAPKLRERQPEPVPAEKYNKAAVAITRSLVYAVALVLVLVAVVCSFIIIYLYWTGGRPVIEIVR